MSVVKIRTKSLCVFVYKKYLLYFGGPEADSGVLLHPARRQELSCFGNIHGDRHVGMSVEGLGYLPVVDAVKVDLEKRTR